MAEEEQTLEDLADRRQVYRDLLRSAGWKDLAQVLEDQIEARHSRDRTMDLVREEYALEQLVELRAERRALQLVLGLPEAIINDLTLDIEEETNDPESRSDS